MSDMLNRKGKENRDKEAKEYAPNTVLTPDLERDYGLENLEKSRAPLKAGEESDDPDGSRRTDQPSTAAHRPMQGAVD